MFEFVIVPTPRAFGTFGLDAFNVKFLVAPAREWLTVATYTSCSPLKAAKVPLCLSKSLFAPLNAAAFAPVPGPVDQLIVPTTFDIVMSKQTLLPSLADPSATDNVGGGVQCGW